MRPALAAAALAVILCARCLAAESPPAKPSAEKSPAVEQIKPQAAAVDALLLRQEQTADEFRRFEAEVLRMAEVLGATEPERAALLRKAVAQSKERLVSLQFDRVTESLKKDQLSEAITGQGEVVQELKSLLELLLSENRARRLESEKARIREYLKRIGVLLKEQKGLQGETAGQGEPRPLADRQGKLGEKTGELAKDIKKAEETQSAEDGGGKPQSPPDNGGKPQSPPEGKGKPAESKSPGGSKPSPNQNPSQGPSDGGNAKQESPSEENPARKRLEAARQRMEEARKKLDEANRKQATDKQEEAIRELEQAKTQLEEILRQLREEEVGRILAMLETRFRRMLELQVKVYEATARLGKIPEPDRGRDGEIEAGRLSQQESQIALEAAAALAVLREEGSAAALAEAVVQMRDDMEQVVQRLARTDVGTMTQDIEKEIIAALEEMVAALAKAQKDRENKRPPSPSQSGQQGEPPLVDVLAELRVIRTLQMRVNSRTERYSKLIEGEQADKPDVLEALRNLAERESRIHRAARDIVTGKNK
ncbi:MAG: hypothetical protein ACYC0Y_14770 [Pirellulales bacterium]